MITSVRNPTPPTPESERASVEGFFDDAETLTRAVELLAEQSVPADSIRVFLVDESGDRGRELEVEDEAGALRGALIGAGLGAVVGVVLVVLVTAGAFGPVGVDPLGARGAFGGVRAIVMAAAAGVPLGALLGMGHWQGRKKISGAEMRDGSAVVVVASDELESLARQVLREAGASRVTG